MSAAIQKYAPLLWKRWEASDESPSAITGFWGEDGHPFLIQVPPQMRDLIVDLQNTLSDKYNHIKSVQVAVFKMESELASVLTKGPRP